MVKIRSIPGLFRSVVVLASGTATAQAVLLVSAPLLTRLYTPDQFGVLAAYMASITIFGAFSTFRFELVVPLPRQDAIGMNALALTLICVAMTALLCALALPMSSEALARWMNIPALPRISWLVPFGVLSIGTYTALSNWAVRRRRFAVIARTKMTQAVSQTAIQVAAAFSPFATLGLLFGNLLGQSAGITSFSREIANLDRGMLRRVTLKRMWFLARYYWRFPAFSLPASVAFSAGQQAPALAMFSMFGPATAGFFLLAQRVGMMPATLIGTAISQSIFRNLAVNKKSPLEVGKAAARPVKLMSTLLIGPAVLCAFLAPPFVGVVFGPEWIEAGYYLSWMAPWVAASIIFGAMSPMVSVLGFQKMGLAFQVLSLGASLGVMYLAGITWGSVAAIAGYALTKSVSMLLYRLNMFHLVGISPWPIAASIATQLLTYLVLFGSAWMIAAGDWPPADWRLGTSAVLLAAGALVYGTLAVRSIRRATKVAGANKGSTAIATPYVPMEAD